MNTTHCSHNLSGARLASSARIIGALTVAGIGLALLGVASAQENGPRGPRGPRGPQGPGAGFQPPAPENIAARMLERSDANNDGFLSRDELVAAVGHRLEQGGRPGGPRGPRPPADAEDRPEGFQPPSPEEIASHMLEKSDADGNGQLSKDELIDAIKARHEEGRGPRPPFGEGRPGPREEGERGAGPRDGGRPGPGFGGPRGPRPEGARGQGGGPRRGPRPEVDQAPAE